MSNIQSLCVFCGSRNGADPAYAAEVTALDAEIARRNIRLVYGGGNIGLMGLLADAVEQGGGVITGVIPGFLDKAEIGRRDAEEFVVTGSMHERKNRMFEAADGFITLPGGLGTLDETFEIITWKQLGIHDKPIVVLDAAGYWRPFANLVEHVIGNGFADESARDLFTVVDTVAEAFRVLEEAPEPRRAASTERL